jgi:hypothetical protein
VRGPRSLFVRPPSIWIFYTWCWAHHWTSVTCRWVTFAIASMTQATRSSALLRLANRYTVIAVAACTVVVAAVAGAWKVYKFQIEQAPLLREALPKQAETIAEQDDARSQAALTHQNRRAEALSVEKARSVLRDNPAGPAPYRMGARSRIIVRQRPHFSFSGSHFAFRSGLSSEGRKQ